MKLSINSLMLLFFPAFLAAQTVEDANKMIYHERFNSAETTLHTLLKSEPSHTAAWYALSRAYIGNHDSKTLKDSLLLAPEQVKNDPLIKTVLAHIMLIENDTVNAKMQFGHILKETKMKDPAVLAEIAGAIIDSKSGNANEAIELLEKAVKKDKNNPAMDILIGDAYRKLNDGGKAYKSYMSALDKDPAYAAAEYKIGKIYTSQKNPVCIFRFLKKR